MFLDVKNTQQSKNSVECGIACVTMLLNHYRINVSYEDVYSKLKSKLSDLGLSSPALGSYIMDNHNLEVEIITLNPLLLTVNEIRGSQEKITHRIEDRLKGLTQENDQRIAKEFLSFLNNGGIVTGEIPSFKRIKTEIDGNSPMIAGLTSNFLHGRERFNFHYNVITGYDDEFIFVNDPNFDETGGKNKHPIDQYLFAIAASCYGDLDNAAFLKIRNKA